MSVRLDEQKLAPSAKIVLFELDATQIGGSILRFTPMLNEKQTFIVWQGNTYTPFPIKAEGFEWTGQGVMPRPTLTASNISGVVTALVLAYDDLVNAKITRRMTLARYLDATNFAAGNPHADPSAGWPDEVYFVNRKVSESRNVVSFELSSAMDVEGVRVPRRFVVKNVCPWTYRSSECSYAGGPVAKEDDSPTSDPNQDVCGKRLVSCKLRFGTNVDLPYGGFPTVGLIT